MTFDNTPLPTTNRWQVLKDHLPIFLVVGGAVTLFLSLHIAAWAVAIAAGGHVVLGAAIAGVAWYRNRTVLK